MASGNFISNTGTNLNLYVVWSSTSNVDTNKSSVTAKVYMRSYTISGTALTDSYISINGNKKSFAGTSLSKTSSSLTDTLIATHTVSVAHDSDGTKSITIKANLEFNGTVSGKYLSDITASKTVKLDSIPRASALSVPSSVNVYSNLTVTINPASSSHRHKVKFVIDGTTKYTSGYIASGTKTFSYLIPRSWISGTSDKKMTVYLYTYTSSGTSSIGSKTATTTIKVPCSSFTIPTSANTGSAFKITISPDTSPSGSWKHKVGLIIGGTFKHTSDFIVSGTNSYSYTVPPSWLSATDSTTMTVRLYTYNPNSDDDYTARTDKTLTIKVPDSVVPSVTSVTPAIVNGLNGKYVQGKSQVKLTVSAEAGDGSSLSSYIYKGANINNTSSSYTGTSSSKTSSVITATGKQTYSVQVKDKRGRTSASKSTSITVYEHSAPKITSITAQRCLANGTLDDSGTYAKVTVKTTHSSIGGANTATVKLTNNKDSTSTQIISSTNASNTYSGVYSSGFDNQSSYTITATITDSLGATYVRSTTLAATQRVLNIAKYGNGVAVGKLSLVTSSTATPRFECNWDTTFYDDVRIKHSSSRCFEWIRTGIADDVDNDGTNETADIQGQLYVADNGSITCRRRYSTDDGESYTAQGYWQLRNEDMYVNDALTVTGAITTNARFGFNGGYNDHNFNIYGQWADGANHDILVRGTDGLSMGLGWTGGDDYETSLDIRPKKVSIRGETTVQGFRVPEIQKGSVSITPSAANTPTAKIVTFSKAFSSTPAVVANPLTGVPGTYVTGVAAASPSETQVTIYLTRTNTSSTGIQWIAVN